MALNNKPNKNNHQENKISYNTYSNDVMINKPYNSNDMMINKTYSNDVMINKSNK